MAGPLPLAVALLAVLGLVLLAHALGFSRRAVLTGPDEALALVQSLPGGFVPGDMILDRQGGGAVLRDRHGRIAVVAPVGVHFLARLADGSWHVAGGADGKVAIRGSDFSAQLDLGADGPRWLALLAGPQAEAA